MSEHIAAELLAAWVDGALDAGRRPGVEAHLSRCHECREALAEVSEMRRSREKIPGEFLRRGLGVAAAESPSGRRLPNRTAMPARLVFGIAAVFLVAALLGYYFLGRGGMGPVPAFDEALPSAGPRRPPGELPAVVAEDDRPPAPAAGTAADREETLLRSLPARQALAEKANGVKLEKKTPAAEYDPGPPAPPVTGKAAAPAALPAKAELERAVENEDPALPGDAAAGAVGGVLGGVEAPPEENKQDAMNLAAAPAARAQGFAKNDKGIPRAAAASGRSKGAGKEDSLQPRSRFPGSGASGDAMQLFLAVTGRAAAPPALTAAALSPLRIEGDAAPADLLDAGIFDGWDWFPPGGALELTIDAAGAVESVRLIGEWADREAERAREAAMKLAFRPSARRTRRAVLSR